MFWLSLALAAPPEGPFTLLAPTALTTVVPLTDAAQSALIDRDHAAAVTALAQISPTSMHGNVSADLAFLKAWSLQRAGRTSEALPLLDMVKQAENAPSSYVAMLEGELLSADGRTAEAVNYLAQVDSGAVWVRARLALAEAYMRLDRTSDARAVWLDLITRPDPSPGSATALYQLSLRSPVVERDSYRQRLYRSYPGTGEDGAVNWTAPSLEDLAWRGDVLQEKGNWDNAVSLLAPRLAEAGSKDPVGCRYRYAYGRALHKQSNLTSAIEILAPLGKGCKGQDDERAAKALYLVGKAYERKKDWASAANYYKQIPLLYPTHSMADDGYALGGIALQEAGDLPGARNLWAAGLKAYPKGDLAAETAWRLAWGAYLAGDVTEAIRQADEAVATIPIDADPTHYLACVYWAARWRAWPDNTQNRDTAHEAEAADKLEALARRAPWHWYGYLAYARLKVLAPERAEALKRPEMDSDAEPWQVREAWMAQPAVRNAMGLVRVGLLSDALSELSTLDEDSFTGAEMAITTGIQTRTGKFLMAHDRMRSWLKTHPPEDLGPNTYKVLRQAYPPMYWDDIQKVAGNYTWDDRVFHALVREESNFNPQIKSFAGACGLSQLMPATASTIAKRAGVSYSSSRIWDIQTNLKIGSYYLDMLHSRYKGNSALALAGYNAGEGNADRWLTAYPDWPTDAYVEGITFRETRFYVKRVMSTFLTYHLVYDGGPLYPDGSTWALDAVP